MLIATPPSTYYFFTMWGRILCNIIFIAYGAGGELVMNNSLEIMRINKDFIKTMHDNRTRFTMV